MANEEEVQGGVKVEHREDYDVLHFSIPIPKFGMCLPEDTRQHLRAARKERLLAMRSLIDHWIHRLEQANQTKQTGAQQINVE